METASANYTVLARRFRPQTFDEVVGQQHVAQALRNAIHGNRVAHAYLFTGARGVGKTSMARILAKALNCPNVKDGNPCNECEICRGIAAGQDVDVSEIDGASNRGIDDIRSLRANVNVKSMRSRYKMYIIDEVHMLTKEAFNALLKTLEEPPPSVKFVFCTTEPNKVPDTILSRCQRFDFTTIETAAIMDRLQQIADAEGYEVEPAALELVARRAGGSMRDSQSLFDQLLAFGEAKITPTDVHRLLGTADDDRLTELVGALIERRTDTALQSFDAALTEGVQLGELVDQLLNYLRDLMIVATGAEGVTLLAVGVGSRPKLAEQAKQWGLQTIMAAMQILADAKTRMGRVSFGRALVELALVRIAVLEDLEEIARLVAELRAGGSGTGNGVPPRPKTLAVAPPRPAPAAAPPAARQPAPLPTPEKKSPAEAVSLAEPPESVASPPPVIDFAPGVEGDLHAQLLVETQGMLRTYIQAGSIAISGPNRLDLLFPKSYDLGRKHCERPEVRSQLEAALGRLTGKKIHLTLRLAEAEETEKPRPKEARPVEKRRVDPENDGFVEQAKSIFGASVIKVEELRSRESQEENERGQVHV